MAVDPLLQTLRDIADFLQSQQLESLAGRPRDTDDVAKIILRQGDALDWEYVLRTAQALEQAIGHELVAPLECLRRDS